MQINISWCKKQFVLDGAQITWSGEECNRAVARALGFPDGHPVRLMFGGKLLRNTDVLQTALATVNEPYMFVVIAAPPAMSVEPVRLPIVSEAVQEDAESVHLGRMRIVRGQQRRALSPRISRTYWSNPCLTNLMNAIGQRDVSTVRNLFVKADHEGEVRRHGLQMVCDRNDLELLILFESHGILLDPTAGLDDLFAPLETEQATVLTPFSAERMSRAQCKPLPALPMMIGNDVVRLIGGGHEACLRHLLAPEHPLHKQLVAHRSRWLAMCVANCQWGCAQVFLHTDPPPTSGDLRLALFVAAAEGDAWMLFQLCENVHLVPDAVLSEQLVECALDYEQSQCAQLMLRAWPALLNPECLVRLAHQAADSLDASSLDVLLSLMQKSVPATSSILLAALKSARPPTSTALASTVLMCLEKHISIGPSDLPVQNDAVDHIARTRLEFMLGQIVNDYHQVTPELRTWCMRIGDSLFGVGWDRSFQMQQQRIVEAERLRLTERYTATHGTQLSDGFMQALADPEQLRQRRDSFINTVLRALECDSDRMIKLVRDLDVPHQFLNFHPHYEAARRMARQVHTEEEEVDCAL